MFKSFSQMGLSLSGLDTPIYVSSDNDLLSSYEGLGYSLVDNETPLSRVQQAKNRTRSQFSGMTQAYFAETTKLSRLHNFLIAHSFGPQDMSAEQKTEFASKLPEIATSNVDMYNTVSLFKYPKEMMKLYTDPKNWRIYPGELRDLVNSVATARADSSMIDLCSAFCGFVNNIARCLNAMIDLHTFVGFPVPAQLNASSAANNMIQDIDWGRNRAYPALTTEQEQQLWVKAGLGRPTTSQYTDKLYMMQPTNIIGLTWDCLELSGLIISHDGYTLVCNIQNATEKTHSGNFKYMGYKHVGSMGGMPIASLPGDQLRTPSLISSKTLPYELAPMSKPKMRALEAVTIMAEHFDAMALVELRVVEMITEIEREVMARRIAQYTDSIAAPQILEYANEFAW